MRYQGKHRILEALDKGIEKGQIIHFLTGPGIRDNYLYDIYHGIMGLEETLKQYYLLDTERPYDFFIHVVSATQLKCYRAKGRSLETIEFQDLFEKKAARSPLRRDRKAMPPIENDKIQEAAEQAEQAGAEHRIGQLTELLKNGNRRVIVFIEHLEWVANLYGGEPDLSWIAAAQSWIKMRNLLLVMSISDFEMLAKYNFEMPDTFIGYPSAEEVRLAYLRYLMRNTNSSYGLDMQALDDIAHRISMGKKTLVSSMRILRNIVRQHPDRLREEDFAACAEVNIEEKVLWENVRLPESIKNKIKRAVDKFLAEEDASRARKGLLLTGPPGTGKTMIAKALANEARCYFMAPKLADLKAEYVGQSSAKVKRVFAEARANAPTILFIDEADTVFPSRNGSSTNQDSYTLDIVNQSLQEIDGADTGKQKIFIIAATNRVEVIDAAIRSRLSQTPIEIPLPERRERQLMFDDGLSKEHEGFTICGKCYEELILSRSVGMSGRDIANFTKKIQELKLPLYDNEETYALFNAEFEALEQSYIADMTGANGVFSDDSIYAPEKNSSRMDDIIGYEGLKEIIRQQANFIKATPEEKLRYEKFNIPVQKGILMYGPPGNGKTELAKAAAGELGFYFFKIISRDFTSTTSEMQIRKLSQIFQDTIRFSKIMTKAPGIVLFFDEIDALAGNSVMNPEVRGSLLNFLGDQSLRDRNSKILLIAATNYVESLDDAVKRKGRIDVHYSMDNPPEDAGKRMLSAFFDNDYNIEDVEESVVEEAYKNALKDVRNAYIRATFGTLNWETVVRDSCQSESWLHNIDAHRPSGSDLRTLYGELKSIAFNHNKIQGDKLIVDMETVNLRFSDQSAS